MGVGVVRVRSLLVALVCAVFVAGCGGGGTNANVPGMPATTPDTTGATDTVPLSASASSYALPVLSGFSGSVDMAAAAFAAPGTLTVQSSLSCAAGPNPLSGVRRTQSQTITVFYCATFTPSRDVTYASLPSIQLYAPPGVNGDGKHFYYAISTPPPPGAVAQFLQEGPAVVTPTGAGGCALKYDATFAPDPTPLTLKAHVPTVFAFYSISDPTPAPPAGTVVEYAPKLSGTPNALATGPDGNVWFTENAFSDPSDINYAKHVGRITPSGEVTEFPVLASDPQAVLYDVTAGHDGNLWFTAGLPCFACPTSAQPHLERIAPDGTVTDFSSGLKLGATPLALVAGPQNAVWAFEAAQTQAVLARIAADGTVTEYPLTGIGPPPADVRRKLSPTNATGGEIAADTQGNLWITGVYGGPEVFRVTQTGAATAVAPGSGLALGPDGNVWFTNTSGVGRVSPGGKIAQFSAPNPNAIAAGPDGNLWFTQSSPAQIGRITPNGTVTEFSGVNAPGGIVAGSDGWLWFTEPNGFGKIHP